MSRGAARYFRGLASAADARTRRHRRHRQHIGAANRAQGADDLLSEAKCSARQNLAFQPRAGFPSSRQALDDFAIGSRQWDESTVHLERIPIL